MSEANWLLDSIKAKSDQLNAVDLLGGPITVSVTSVKQGDAEQPVVIGITGDRQPYKPCKSMRRVLIACWGANPNAWVGRKMTLYCESKVKWAGEEVGGIRISHLSHLGAAHKEIQLNESKHKKTTWKVFEIVLDVKARFDKAIAAIKSAANKTELDKRWTSCQKLHAECSDELKLQLEAAKQERAEALS